MGDVLFATWSPLGYPVECSYDTWNAHIAADDGHPIMRDNVANVVSAIENPDAVFYSSQTTMRHVYFQLSQYSVKRSLVALYTKVVVDVSARVSPGKVVSAWPQNTMSGGIGGMMYVKPKL